MQAAGFCRFMMVPNLMKIRHRQWQPGRPPNKRYHDHPGQWANRSGMFQWLAVIREGHFTG
jgi:hypothetical protein